MNLLGMLGTLAFWSALLIIIVGVLFFRGSQRFKALWLSSPLFIRRFISHLSVGLSLLLITFFSLSIPTAGMLEQEEFSMDLMMGLYKNVIPPAKEKEPPFVLLDIDDETLLSWSKPNEPLSYIPLVWLKNLIDTAVQAKARLIIVDVDLNESLKPHKQELWKYLKDHVTKCRKENQLTCSPIILARAVDSSKYPVRPLTGFFEDVVSAPYVQWGSTEFYSFEAPDLARRWKLWEPTCTRGKGQPGMLPSIELLAMGIIRDCSKNIQDTLSQFQPQNCNDNDNNDNEVILPTSVTLCGLEMSSNPYSVQQRIMYRIPWLDTEKTLGKETNISGKLVEKFAVYYDGANEVPVLKVFSAQSYAEKLKLPEDLKAIKAILADKIVVIGASYHSMNKPDFFSTPIGEMPGALVIINATYALLQGLIIKPVSLWSIVVVLIIIFSLLSSVPERWMHLGQAGIIIIIIVLLGCSIILLESAIWLNIAVPVAIIETFRIIYQMKWLKRIAHWLFALPWEVKNNLPKHNS